MGGEGEGEGGNEAALKLIGRFLRKTHETNIEPPLQITDKYDRFDYPVVKSETIIIL